MGEETLAGIMAFAVPLTLLVMASGIFVIRKRTQKPNKELRQRIVDSAVEAMIELKNENVLWVAEFNRKLSSDLGGVLGVMNTFADPARMLRLVVGLTDQMHKCQDAGINVESLSSAVSKMLSEKFPANYCLAVCRYVRLFGESFERLHGDIFFRKWVRSTKPSCQPDMETQAILQVVLGRIEQGERNV